MACLRRWRYGQGRPLPRDQGGRPTRGGGSPRPTEGRHRSAGAPVDGEGGDRRWAARPGFLRQRRACAAATRTRRPPCGPGVAAMDVVDANAIPWQIPVGRRRSAGAGATRPLGQASCPGLRPGPMQRGRAGGAEAEDAATRRDETTHLMMSALEFIHRLAALVRGQIRPAPCLPE